MKVVNNESDIAAVVATVSGLAGQVVRAVDITGAPSALTLGVLGVGTAV